MRITNDYNIPEPIAKALTPRERTFKEKHISVTELINPPLIYHLTRKYYDKLTVDVSDRLWALLGTAIHKVLEDNAPENSKSEESLLLEIDGWEIAGRMDLYQDKKIIDYKVTSAMSFVMGDKKMWENQLNIYAYMFRKKGFEVNEIWIYAILRDWSLYKANHQIDYPPIPFLTKKVPLWTFEEQEKFIKERLKLFEGEPQECTPEEKWQSGGEYALMRKGRKTAIKLMTKEEADRYELKPNEYFEKRPVRNRRCEAYCPVREVCPYARLNNDKI